MRLSTYGDLLRQEAEVWNRAAEGSASHTPPDWVHHCQLRTNIVSHRADVDAILRQVRPGMRVLDLGCSSGWLTLAMAQRGARAVGIDIADRAIQIAKDYFEAVRPTVKGEARYEVADLNHIDLPHNEFDLVVARGVFHHVAALERLITEIHRTLKTGGLLWVSDQQGHVAPGAALLAGAIFLLLPTHVSYREKLSALIRFGIRAPDRVRASMEAQGSSPFEGIGRDVDWIELIRRQFSIELLRMHPAITGYLAAEVALPDALADPLLKLIGFLDDWLVRSRVLRSSGVTMRARKGRPTPEG